MGRIGSAGQIWPAGRQLKITGLEFMYYADILFIQTLLQMRPLIYMMSVFQQDVRTR